MNTNWGRGYYTAQPYTMKFFRELAPNWLDLMAAAQGHAPPRSHDGESFRYLDLGCGTAFNISALAALYPEGKFVGVDFNPTHITIGKHLSKIADLLNLDLFEYDIIDLKQLLQTSGLGDINSFHQGFDYIICHGIISWVSHDVRDAIFDIVQRLLVPGGIFYCSYNSLPGSSHRSIIQQVIRSEVQASASSSSDVIARSLAILKSLLTSQTEAPALLRAFPGLKDEIDKLDHLDPSYLVHEFGGDNWHPFYVTDIHRAACHHKLNAIGTATACEVAPLGLPQSVTSLLNSLPENQDLFLWQDLILNQSFRRDLFSKGTFHLNRTDHERIFGHIRIVLLDKTVPPSNGIQATYGKVIISDDNIESLLELIGVNSPSLAEVCSILEKPSHELNPIILLLIHAGIIGIHRSCFDNLDPFQPVLNLNLYLATCIKDGDQFDAFLAPLIGTCLPITPFELLTQEALLAGLKGDMLTHCVTSAVISLGGIFRNSAGCEITDSSEIHAVLSSAITSFKNTRLPVLERLGCF